jgi:hypothetical protein
MFVRVVEFVHTHTHTCIYIYTPDHEYMHVHLDVCTIAAHHTRFTHTFTHDNIHKLTHVYLNIHKHNTYINTYIHTKTGTPVTEPPPASPPSSANPYIMPENYTDIYAVITTIPFPCVAFRNCTITVRVGNSDGPSVVKVSIYYQKWGLSFGGWLLVGAELVHIPAQTSENVAFAFAEIVHEFESKTHVCIKAELEAVGNASDTSKAVCVCVCVCVCICV